MTFPGLVKANNLSDIGDKEKAWDNLGSNISATLFATYDPDVLNYINAVQAADGQLLEPEVVQAIGIFVNRCKSDDIWTAIKACCILAGARTLAGALVPLVGPAPTSINFVSGDYNRKTGLVGNGSTKYLNSNRANNADPQNNNHNVCWVSTPGTGVLMASSNSLTGRNYMDIPTLPATRLASRSTAFTSNVSGTAVAGLYGHSRSSSAQASYRCPQGSGLSTYSSQATDTRNVFLYTRTDNGISFAGWSLARIAFYSIGESLNLALLDARVTTLVNTIAGAIP